MCVNNAMSFGRTVSFSLWGKIEKLFKRLWKICLHKHFERFIQWCSAFYWFRKVFRYKGMRILSKFTAIQGIWHIPTLLYALSTRLIAFILFSLKFLSLELWVVTTVFIYRILAVFVCVVLLCSKLWRIMLFWSLETELLIIVDWLCWNSLLS